MKRVRDFVADLTRAGKGFTEISILQFLFNEQFIFFIFRKVIEGLAGQSLDQDSIKNAWEGVTRTLTAVAFTAAFRSWMEHCKQCVCIGGKFIKNLKTSS
jgi:hypothetical protein